MRAPRLASARGVETLVNWMPAVRLAILLSAVIAIAAPAGAAVITTFDTGTEGWLVTGDNASVWSATGGNPGGCFDVNDLATGANNSAGAPPAYLGDWSAMTAADSIGVDFFFQHLSGTITPPAYLFRISGPGGSARTLQGFVPPQNVWSSIAAPLDSTTWVIESGSWAALMAHVNTVLMQVEFVTGNEEVRFDNVRLTGPVTPIFVPCLLETFNTAGLGDWSFTGTGGVSNPGNFGNGGGFCQIGEGTPTSQVFVPSRFLGNWSPLDGTGRIAFDMRVLNISGPTMDVPEFIRLSGPGGVARVGLTTAQISTAPGIWKRYEFPLQESAWTIVTGTWSGVLQNVTEFRIQAEVAAGIDVVGLDNIGRLAAACPAPDQTIVVHSLQFERCGELSFVAVGAIALNPANGQLYTVVDAATSGGGGLWPVTGPGAGVRLQTYTTPAGLIFDETGNAYISEDTGGNVFRYSGGVSSVWVSGFHTGDDDPTGMCFAPAGFDGPNVDPGDILVTDPGFSGADEVWSFKTSVAENELQVIADLPGNPQFNEIATGPPGVVYTASTVDPNNIYSMSPAGVLTPIALSTPLTGMVGLAWDPVAARLFVAETGGRTLRRVDPSTGAVELIASGFQGFNDGGLEFDAANEVLYVADAGQHRVYRICKTPTVSVPWTDGPRAPSDITALAVTPNPARGSARITWSLQRRADARVTIFDLAGRAVRRVSDGMHEAGAKSRTWDGRDQEGHPVAAGLYLVRVETDRGARTSRITILK